jgi:DNA-binding protein HU-beta
MNKKQLVEVVSGETGFRQKDVSSVLDCIVDTIKGNLKKGEKVQLFGFGTFEVVERAARTGINPRTKEKIKIAAKKATKFKPAKELKTL